jgi:hypothetical protein
LSGIHAMLTNVFRGLGFGLLMATGFTAWITVIRLTSGDAPFERTGTPFWSTVLFYYAGFAIGGALAGSVWSFLHRRAIGWFIMGLLLVAPVYAVFVIVDESPAKRWSSWNIGAVIFGAVVVGGLNGLRMWSIERNNGREPATNWRFVAGGLVVAAALALLLYLMYW